MAWRWCIVIALVACDGSGLHGMPRPSGAALPQPSAPKKPTSEPQPSAPEPPPDEPPPPPARKGAIEGDLCGPSSGPWVNARVWLDVGTQHFETTTDLSGHFVLHDVPEGAHTVYASAGLYRTSQVVQVVGDQRVLLPAAECASLSKTKLAVYMGGNDDIAAVLQDLGATDVTAYFDWMPGAPRAVDLFELPTLMQFAAVFIACGSGVDLVSRAAVLRDYVAAGGIVYASDWAYPYIEAAWPDRIDFVGDDASTEEAKTGVSSEVDATLHPPLSTALQASSAHLEFAAAWVVMTSSTADVWAEGDVVAQSGSLHVPLLVVFAEGKGKVTYTSFHTHGQEQGDVRALIELLIGQL